MFFRILKRDLKKKKAINLIILLFIVISTMLIAASVNTLLSSTNAVSKYIERANVPDFMCSIYDLPGEKERLEEFLDGTNSKYDVEKNLMIDEIENSSGEKKDTGGAICRVPSNYGKVFDKEGNQFELKDNEVALTALAMEDIGVVEGDTITITINDCEKELKTVLMYDAMYGTIFVSFNRMVVNDKIYEEYDLHKNGIAYFYNLDLEEATDEFNSKLLLEGFNFLGCINGEEFESCYFFEKLVAIVLCVVSIILVLIAFLILRFTIVFTIQEEYREIGIMKAMGMKKRKIKGIYLVKYLFLNVIGAIIGFALSFPVYFAMIKTTTTTIYRGLDFSYVMASLLFVVIVVLVIEGFCYLCTRKIDKLSPITSIRNGKESENYKKCRKINMYKHKLSVSTQMALGDIVSGFRRFFVLFLTFFLCTIMLILSFAVTGTLQSDKMITYFGCPEFDVKFYSASEQGKWYQYSDDELVENIKQIEKDFENKGFKMDIYGEASSIAIMSNLDNKDVCYAVAIRKTYNRSIADYPCTKGSGPILGSEVAITTNMAEMMNVNIGDKVVVSIMDKEYELIITGLFDSMHSLGGMEIRLADEFDYSTSAIASFMYYGYNSEVVDPALELEKEFDDYSFINMDEFLNDMIGSIRDKLGYMVFMIILIISIILILIVFLLNKLMISRETPEIAMLKSLGFNNKKIYAWQVKRMALIVGLSLLTGLALAYPISYLIVPTVFKIMGAASVTVEISAFQVFVLTPLIFLGIIVVGTGLGIGQIRKVRISEINNQE